MADLTPLSISRPLDENRKRARPDQDSYGAKVKRRSFKPDDSPKPDFGSEYRDNRAISPPSSPATSFNHFTQEPMANITDKHAYRPTGTDPYPSDQEEDADDGETHAIDDDLDYAADTEEDEGYDSLESQFKNVIIRKRQRDDLEDAEDDGDLRQAADNGLLDGRRKQNPGNLALTEEERAHRRKKLRTVKRASTADGLGRDVCGTERKGEVT